jgi:nitroreductase
MDVIRALEQRRMQRSFDGSPLEEEQIRALLEASLRSPTAGNARGIRWVLALGPEQVAQWFAAATDEAWRAKSARAEGFSRASAACVLICDPGVYLDRYSESDKANAGLGEAESAWAVPYWFGDAGAAALALLLLVEESGLAGCFLGAFRHEDHLRRLLGLSDTERIYGTVLLGRSDGENRRSASLDRPGPTRAERVTRLA